MVPKPIIAVMASVPGTAIILDKSLAPFARHRWHAKVIVHLEYFENQLKYEKVAPSIINKKDSEFMIQIEDCYPSISIGNRNDIPDQNNLKLPDEVKNQN